ncbi:MAG: flagellar hook-length control protein FliK [Lachnospiraceae bacterium]|nr:flagellar hook-length control protein FliK [Lachnospiraceae bacterium]
MNFNINNLLQNYTQADAAGNEDNLKTRPEEIINGKPETGGTDGTMSLKQLSVGDIFRAKILDIRNLEVRIQLSNSQEVKALMGDALELNIGEELTFQVKASGEHGIVLRPVGNSDIPFELVTKSLLSAGLSVNDKNIAVVKELISSGQPIDRQSVLNMVKLLNTYKGESIEKLSQMMKHGIKITPENLEQYDKYMNYEHKISDGIQNLSNALADYFQEDKSGDVKPMIQLFTQLSQALQEHPEIGLSEFHAQTVTGETESNPVTVISAEVQKPSEPLNAAESLPQNAGSGQGKQTVEINIAQKDFSGASGPEKNEVSNHIKQDNVQNPAVSDTAPWNSVTEKLQNAEHAPLANDLSQGDSLSKIMDTIRHADTFQELAEVLGQIDRQDFTESQIVKILHSSSFRNAVKSALRNKGLLNISGNSDETILDKKDINNLYERLLRAADTIEKNMKGENPRDNNLLNQAKDLKNNIMFMNELNQIASYVQLPYKINSRQEQGDLYVYGRKRRKTDANEKITAFLHLDLDYLGATDVSVELVNQAVSAKFTLNNRISEKLVEEHLHELQARLEQKGYSVNLSAETVSQEQTADSQQSGSVLNHIFEHDESTSSIKRYSFDIRA